MSAWTRLERETHEREVVVHKDPLQVAAAVEFRATIGRQVEDFLEGSVDERGIRCEDSDGSERRHGLKVLRIVRDTAIDTIRSRPGRSSAGGSKDSPFKQRCLGRLLFVLAAHAPEGLREQDRDLISHDAHGPVSDFIQRRLEGLEALIHLP